MQKLSPLNHFHSQLTLFGVQAAVKEYDAPWLEDGKKVARDASGKFASRDDTPVATPELDEVQKAIDEQLTSISDGLKEFQKKQLGDINKEIVDRATKRLEELAAARKELAGELTDLMFGEQAAEARKQLAKLCRPINLDLSQAVEQDPFEEIGADLNKLRQNVTANNVGDVVKDLPKAFMYSGYKYNKLIKDLENAEGDYAEISHIAGKAIAVSVPVAAFLGLTVGSAAIAGVLSHGIVAAAAVGSVKGSVATAAAAAGIKGAAVGKASAAAVAALKGATGTGAAAAAVKTAVIGALGGSTQPGALAVGGAAATAAKAALTTSGIASFAHAATTGLPAIMANTAVWTFKAKLAEQAVDALDIKNKGVRTFFKAGLFYLGEPKDVLFESVYKGASYFVLAHYAEKMVKEALKSGNKQAKKTAQEAQDKMRDIEKQASEIDKQINNALLAAKDFKS